jgi:hypothetical protein
MRLAAAMLIGCCTPLTAQVGSPDTTGFRVIVSFPVTDTQPRHEASLTPALLLRVYRALNANGTAMGWYVAVYRQPVEDSSRNLLYHSLAWHGPYPTDMFAWHHAQGYFPDDRILPVYGEPLELRLLCVRCETEGDSTFAHFVSGTVSASVRPAPALPAVSPD